MNRMELIILVVVGLATWTEVAGITLTLKKEKVKQKNLIMNDAFGERLSNKHDVIYKGTITVGTPPKKFNVILDTGSGLFWLPARGCKSSGPHAESCKDASMQYDPDKSSTAKSMSKTFSMFYGTGSASGRIYTDTLRIGDPGAGKQLVMENTPVGAASLMKYIDTGIIGLSLRDPRNPKPVFEQLVDEGKMDKPIFTTFMKKCGGECEDGGVVTLGDFDNQNCQEPIHWSPVVTGTSMWRFRVSGMKIGSYSAQNLNYFAITDTGTSYIHIPSPLFQNVIRELKAQKQGEYHLLPCDSKFQMEFTVTGKTFSVTEKEVLLNQGFEDKCVVAIEDAGSFDMFLLGDAFIRGHCQVYDIKAKRVGFASVRNNFEQSRASRKRHHN